MKLNARIKKRMKRALETKQEIMKLEFDVSRMGHEIKTVRIDMEPFGDVP